MDTGERIDQLERELMGMKRRYRRLLVGLVAAVVAVVLLMAKVGGPLAAFAQSDFADEVRARSFILVDAQGELHALLGMSDAGRGWP